MLILMLLMPRLYGRLPESAFGHAVARKAKQQEKYRPSYFVANGSSYRSIVITSKLMTFSFAAALNMSHLALSKISSAMMVQPGKVNLGLNLKFSRRQLIVPSFTRLTKKVEVLP